MHPPLYRPHPKCQHLVEALVACHEENPYSKFFGKCSNVKAAMDVCFKEEKEERRRANAEKAKAWNDAWRKLQAKSE